MEDKTITQQLLQLRTLSKASCIRKFIELYDVLIVSTTYLLQKM